MLKAINDKNFVTVKLDIKNQIVVIYTFFPLT